MDIVPPLARREVRSMSEDTKMALWKKAAYGVGPVVAFLLIVISLMYG